jgi:hypothetical protein
LVALLIATAVFLLFERMDIRQTLLTGARSLLTGLVGLLDRGIELVTDFVLGTSLSHLIAYVLIVGVVGLVAWRLRWRLVTSPGLTEQACPRCGSDLRRIRRRSRDRLIDVFVPVGRYQCSNRDCRWRGLRVRESRYE